MKINIYETVEVSDVQRKQIADLLDGKVGTKAVATRDQMKQFVWNAGEDWETVLEAAHRSLSGVGYDKDADFKDPAEPEDEPEDEPDEDDLL